MILGTNNPSDNEEIEKIAKMMMRIIVIFMAGYINGMKPWNILILKALKEFVLQIGIFPQKQN
jgi:hypothetical protein